MAVPGACACMYGMVWYQALVAHLLAVGRREAEVLRQPGAVTAGHGQLMYCWHDKHYLGAIHGRMPCFVMSASCMHGKNNVSAQTVQCSVNGVCVAQHPVRY